MIILITDRQNNVQDYIKWSIMKLRNFSSNLYFWIMGAILLPITISTMEKPSQDEERWHPKDYDTYSYAIPTIIQGCNLSPDPIQIFFTPKEDEIYLKKVNEKGTALELIAEIPAKSDYTVHKDLIFTTHKNKKNHSQITSGPLIIMAPKEFKSSWSAALELAKIENPKLNDFKAACKKDGTPLNMNCTEADMQQVQEQLIQHYNDWRVVQNIRPRILIDKCKESSYHKLIFMSPCFTACSCIPYHSVHEITATHEYDSTDISLFSDKKYHQNYSPINSIPNFPNLLEQKKASLALPTFSNKVSSNNCLFIKLPFNQYPEGSISLTRKKWFRYHRWLVPDFKEISLKEFNQCKAIADEYEKSHAKFLEEFNNEIVLSGHQSKKNSSEKSRLMEWVKNHPQQFDFNHVATLIANMKDKEAQIQETFIASILKNYKTLQLINFITQNKPRLQAKVAAIESQAVAHYRAETK